MVKSLLEVIELKKYFPVHRGILKQQVDLIKAVDGVSLNVFEGGATGLVGESGCGKSTLARVILRLLPATSGQVKFAGEDLLTLSPKAMTAMRTQIQIVFQDPQTSLNPRKTIRETLSEPLVFHKLTTSSSELTHRVIETLNQVGLSADVLERYPHEFSGGQLQRICIGRAIILQPRLLICDEAVSSLDISVQAQILNLLSQLQRARSLSYLFIAHDLNIVKHFCDHVVVMREGKVLESAPTEELFNSPKSPYTRALLKAIPHQKFATPFRAPTGAD